MNPPERAAYPAKLAYRGIVPSGYDQERLGAAFRRFVWRREFVAIRKIIERNVAAGATILDAPTGTGRFLPLLRGFGLGVRGADISREMLLEARRRVPEMAGGFARSDAEYLPYRDGSFDHVFSLRFVGHLPPATRIRVLREFGRVARRGLIVGYPVLNPVTGLKFRAGNALRRWRTGAPRPWWPATETTMVAELREAGLRIADRQYVFRPLEQVSILYLEPVAPPRRDRVRVAFTAPSMDRAGRWHPVLREFTRLYPATRVLVGRWPGFIKGHENAFPVRRVPGIRFVPLLRTDTGDVRGISWVPPTALAELIRMRPRVILTTGFNLWTLYAIAMRSLGSRVVLVWQGVSPEIGGTDGSLRLRTRRLLGKGIDGAVTNGEDGARYLRELVRMPAGRIVTAVYEVGDPEALGTTGDRSAAEPEPIRPQFLFVGRLTRGKGVHVLLEACRILVARGQKRFSAVLVGAGSQERELKEQATARGLDPWVTWAGRFDHHELGRFYERCDAFVLASLEDTWGVVVMEAMAFGKPVLCSRLAGVRQVIRPGVNGFVFDPGRPEELADAMERFIRDPKLAAALGAQAREEAKLHTPRHAARALADAVALVLDR